MDDKKKYTYMENVLQSINKNYISLPDDEVKRNKQVLEEVLNQIISKMKEKNNLFKFTYNRVFYGGSFYDGLRVGKPEEFDLDLLMTLPKYAEPTLTNSNKPGFLHVQLKAMDKFEKQPEAHRFTGLAGMLDKNNYLMTTKVSSWIEGLVTKALEDFPKTDNATIINTTSGTLQVRIQKAGPAHTLKLQGTVAGKQVIMDVDLVPCFVFTKEKWPPSPYRVNPVAEKSDFFIVPKRPGGNEDVTRYWRLSFQEQERVLINGNRTLKPTVKLLKKLRDSLDHKTIASYYIKTVFLWEVDQNKTLWDNSLSYVFMTMLKKYKDFIEKNKIPYFWNKNNNLLDKANPKALENIANKLKNIIDDIERNPQDPYVVAKYLVPTNQIEQLKSETVIGKKILKLQQQQSSDGATPVLTKTTSIDIQSQSDMLKLMQIYIDRITFQSDKQTKSESDEVDSVRSQENVLMQAVNKLQDSADKLTVTVASLQSDNKKIFRFMENLSVKIDAMNYNIGELKTENRLLRGKLKAIGVEPKEDVYLFADKLNLTATHNCPNLLD